MFLSRCFASVFIVVSLNSCFISCCQDSDRKDRGWRRVHSQHTVCLLVDSWLFTMWSTGARLSWCSAPLWGRFACICVSFIFICDNFALLKKVILHLLPFRVGFIHLIASCLLIVFVFCVYFLSVVTLLVICVSSDDFLWQLCVSFVVLHPFVVIFFVSASFCHCSTSLCRVCVFF